MAQGNTLDTMDVEEYLLDPSRRQQYLAPVFDTVAPSYDRFTRWCSMGFDMAWKRDLLAPLRRRVEPGDTVLDLACGTGDLAFALAPRVPQGRVIGTDITEGMIRQAEAKRVRRRRHNMEFRVADSMALPLPDASVDAVTSGYGLRNCPDHRGVLAEVRRVLKPGGYFASLEFVKPEDPLWRRFFLDGLLLACKFHGWLWHNQPRSYGYLAESIGLFLTAGELLEATRAAGLTIISDRHWLHGAVCVFLARKPESAAAGERNGV